MLGHKTQMLTVQMKVSARLESLSNAFIFKSIRIQSDPQCFTASSLARIRAPLFKTQWGTLTFIDA